MNKRILAAVLAVIAGALVTAAHADDAWIPGSTHLTLEGGLATGGDKLFTYTDTNGHDHSLHAGDAFFTDVGVQHNFADSAWSLRASAGFSVWTESFTTPSNGDVNVSFVYLPVNLLGVYSVGNNHFGAGLAVHVSPKLDTDGVGPNVDFKTAAGLVLQYQYWLFGVRYTAIRYRFSSFSTGSSCVSNCSVDGSSIGVFFNYVF